MWQYYRDSVCTIAAARASDSSNGFLCERLGQRYQVQTCELEPWEDSSKPGNGKRTVHGHPTSIPNLGFKVKINASPLSKRGWVFQEYALSSRILHWTEHELLWECAEMSSSECTPLGVDYGDIGYREPHMKLESMLSGTRNEILDSEWVSLVEHYSELNLTFESDRLMALQGIGARTEEHFNDQYIFGLWKSQFQLGLTWQAAHRRPFDPRNQCIATSWTWASCNGVGVEYSSDDVFGSDCETEIVRDDGKNDVSRKANSECRLNIKESLEKLRFKARRTISPYKVITNKILEKARFHGGGQQIVFDSPDEIPAGVCVLNELGSFDSLKLGVEKRVGDDGVVDARAWRFRRIGIARIHVSRSDSIEQRHGLQTDIEIL